MKSWKKQGAGIFIALAAMCSAWGNNSPEQIARQAFEEFRQGSLESISPLCSVEVRKVLSAQVFQQLHAIFQSLQEVPEIREIPAKRFSPIRLASIRFRFKQGSTQLVLAIDSAGKVCNLNMLHDIELPRLDKSRMLEDFDWMTARLRNTFPLAEANRELFGLDVWKKLAEYRARITGEESPVEFAALLQEALLACKGNHLWLSNVPYTHRHIPAVQKLFTLTAEELNITHTTLVMEMLCNPAFSARPVRLKYHAGKYYSEFKHIQGTAELPYGSELIGIDGRMPDELLPALQDKLNRFDFKRRIFYGNAFNGFGDNFYVFLDRPPREFKFRTPAGREISLKTDDSIRLAPPPHPPFSSAAAVLYLPQEKLLYLRIPAMDMNTIDFYKNEIRKAGNGKEIAAVVLDVRFNPGGSDLVWRGILSQLLEQPLTFKNTSAILDTSEIREYFKRRREVHAKFYPELPESSSVPGQRAGQPLPLLGDGSFLVDDETTEITPAKDSLKLDRPIYVLVQDIYSSTGGLLAAANRSDRLISVGMPNPVSLGAGPDPLHLALPNSKLIFSVEVSADISGCKTAGDTFHGNVEVPVELSAIDFFEYWNSDTGTDRSGWLRHKDPFMRKVFELMKKQNIQQRL